MCRKAIERDREVHRAYVDARVLEVEQASDLAVPDEGVAECEVAVRDLLWKRGIERGRELQAGQPAQETIQLLRRRAPKD